MEMLPLDPEMCRHYETEIREDERIRTGLGQLELVRTRDIVRRHLRGPGLAVLDVGGAGGVHAEWLLADGHRVDLVDPMSFHVAQAEARLGHVRRFTAMIGDARRLEVDADSYDAVLLFGPLYHLPAEADRSLVWHEAHRVLRPGGIVLAMGISRYASLFDGLTHQYLFDPDFGDMLAAILETGVHRNPTARPGWFTTAYFHRPRQLADEAVAAGFDVKELIGVEGMAAWQRGLGERWADEGDRARIVEAARAVESVPELLGLSPHLIVVGCRS